MTDPDYKLVQSKISTIWRRYTEFEQIHDYLLVTYPHVIIPPLPEKRVSAFYSLFKYKLKIINQYFKEYYLCLLPYYFLCYFEGFIMIFKWITVENFHGPGFV